MLRKDNDHKYYSYVYLGSETKKQCTAVFDRSFLSEDANHKFVVYR